MSDLPISAVLPQLISALSSVDAVVLEAPPGAGKTTLVPLALLGQDWLGEQKILLLEPRRIAAKSAAIRLSENLKQPVGQQVGYRIRMETKVGAASIIEVITEGILTRMLQQDPSLEGVGLIIFDEFHERSLNNDLNLALCLEGRELFRQELPLKLLLMSATLNGSATASILGNAPIIRSEGRSYPVEIFYSAALSPRQLAQAKYASDTLEVRIANLIKQLVSQQNGSILVFLPGQREILKVAELVRQTIDLDLENLQIAPLYGNLSFAQQQQAIQPVDKDFRKIVLATNIAETSITIAGITTVIDSGLCRRASYDASTGITRLNTQKISQASSEQRAGRAGRTAPGVCYRLWSEEQQQSLAPFEVPEILTADLSHLVLNLLLWGNTDFTDLAWLNPPRAAQIQQALQLLTKLKAVTYTGAVVQLTKHGEQMCRLPMEPRLAHLCLSAARLGIAALGCDLAALLAESDPLQERQVDILLRIHALNSPSAKHPKQRHNWERIKRQSRQFQQTLAQAGPLSDPIDIDASAERLDLPQQVAMLIALTWPERIGQRVSDSETEYKLANGRRAELGFTDQLVKSDYLAIAHCGGKKQQHNDQIYLACKLQKILFEQYLQPLISEQQALFWDDQADRLRAENYQKIGQIILSSKKTATVDVAKKRQLILELVAKRNLQILPWNKKLQQLRARVNFLRINSPQSKLWPDLSDDFLLANLEQWLAPYLSDNFVDQFKKLAQLNSLDLPNIIANLLPWPLPQQLDQQAPIHYCVPSGSKISIDYSQSPPILAVKLQEMFGCTTTPVIAQSNGRKGVALQLHLLSPAGKPLQITQDIGNFWHTSYLEVKKEMKGKYPRHPWPDDPLTFAATKKTKRRLAQELNN
ncbi:MAG: hypothetical protein OFPII_42310 [Osedax symbiont Rs1]|nr:MAG: hypothetical protein OFPII_42310 [Osedax symbiont Rs1]